jgi:hypothetical protein
VSDCEIRLRFYSSRLLKAADCRARSLRLPRCSLTIRPGNAPRINGCVDDPCVRRTPKSARGEIAVPAIARALTRKNASQGDGRAGASFRSGGGPPERCTACSSPRRPRPAGQWRFGVGRTAGPSRTTRSNASGTRRPVHAPCAKLLSMIGAGGRAVLGRRTEDAAAAAERGRRTSRHYRCVRTGNPALPLASRLITSPF